MLNEPHEISEAESDTVRSLVATYPYFVPGRYIEALQQHKAQPFSADMMSNMQLYMGNWVLFWDYMQNGAGILTEPVQVMQEPISAVQEQKPVLPKQVIIEEEPEVQEPEIIEEEPVQLDKLSSPLNSEEDNPLISPIYTEDYFLHQGIEVSNEIPDSVEDLGISHTDADQSLMVVMSFAEWLQHFKSKSQKEKEEEKGQKALKSMWQKEKLAAALEEENDEIPENVFEMAMTSITNEDDLVSESLAEIYVKQEKYDRAIEMYKKLSLRNPQKSAYFARKIESLQKGKS
jgi:tetratricopeptide (TPR) repeat protein